MGKGRSLVYQRWGILLFLLGTCLGTYAQREPIYTQYMYNLGSFNPAYVVSVENTDITALYRAQWIDIEGAPRTLRFGLNHPFANDRMGMGLNIENDQLGPTSQTYVDLAYAYQVPLSGSSYLAFGMNAGGAFLNVDFSKGSFENPGEPILDRETIQRFYPTLGAGVFLYGEQGYLGISVPNFLKDQLYNEDVESIVEDDFQFNFIGGYVFNLSDEVQLKPAFLLTYLSGSPLTATAAANLRFSRVFTVGAAYRSSGAVSGLAGFQVSGSTFIGYSYDHTTNALGEFAQGSHELILKFYLGKGGASRSAPKRDGKKKNKKIDSPRFF